MEACSASLQPRMSYNEKNDAAFAYESSVHSSNVLRRLGSQREQGILCDVTVVVEDQRFLAHRTVLAACSDYFLSRLVQPCDGDFIITLPEEVTVKGFVPLLHFAYTSKLHVNKDNLLAIQECAKILDIHDIEEACFEFLKLKYQDLKADLQECPRKKCCKSFCPKANVQRQPDVPTNVGINEVEELWRAELPSKIKCAAEIENISTVSESPKKPCETFCFGRENDPDSSALCPKYRKFQKAFKSDRVRSISTCSSNQDVPSPLPVQSSEASENVVMARSQNQPLEMERNELNPQDINVTYLNLPCEEKTSGKAEFPPSFPLGQQDFNPAPFQCSFQPYRSLNYNEVPDPTIEVLPEKPNSDQHVSPTADLSSTKELPGPDLCVPEERSNVEREVAEHLAKGFWPDIYNSEFHCQPEIEMVPNNKESREESNEEKRQECPWLNITISEGGERTFTTLNSVSCPFINTLSSEGCANNSQLMLEECIQEKQQDTTCPYACSMTPEGDSETDSEDDSEESCSAKEQECETKLPFNAQKIISLSRYDFQSLVKRHNLSAEQLDCIHDIRRRSKNRIAAQRCRKRKLDCIQNLECEILKLQNEKEHLLKERDQILNTLGETKQNLTGLCQQVCREAALSREQMQILAKYSSTECPLSFLLLEKDKMLLQCDSMLQACHFAEGLPSVETGRHPDVCNGILPVQTAATESMAPASNSSQTGISDFCKQMTDKCTTDEQT
ncbi:hypothetical protein XENTR_v10004915 [Xenopus tropicalis]|uniref:BTB and CNC homology 1, basic leucine zipper transcription factor 1 n=1 Tax=Xenopus tropicalis TaxID=8364 RepID=F7BYY6_XENTR|nr:transcription regulator protein BACH1 [Xenopus tropicalis]XP_012813478.1 transcription regulator protein BACH1 [Xenopus tropicalis]KAE8621660.1 hypothetical protein XENTR_v10004915 [Xenopus tropicalis]KAE8621661.1 hypothetical protein XENTR_v10004915 [Xenopus tropicalis]|eukprot:XP_017946905.1 PREDICTED: transcription regulator protein BACH1 [Xenopus tropicalis]